MHPKEHKTTTKAFILIVVCAFVALFVAESGVFEGVYPEDLGYLVIPFILLWELVTWAWPVLAAIGVMYALYWVIYSAVYNARRDSR